MEVVEMAVDVSRTPPRRPESPIWRDRPLQADRTFPALCCLWCRHGFACNQAPFKPACLAFEKVERDPINREVCRGIAILDVARQEIFE